MGNTTPRSSNNAIFARRSRVVPFSEAASSEVSADQLALAIPDRRRPFCLPPLVIVADPDAESGEQFRTLFRQLGEGDVHLVTSAAAVTGAYEVARSVGRQVVAVLVDSSLLTPSADPNAITIPNTPTKAASNGGTLNGFGYVNNGNANGKRNSTASTSSSASLKQLKTNQLVVAAAGSSPRSPRPATVTLTTLEDQLRLVDERLFRGGGATAASSDDAEEPSLQRHGNYGRLRRRASSLRLVSVVVVANPGDRLEQVAEKRVLYRPVSLPQLAETLLGDLLY